MINISHGFDGLDITFQGAFPTEILEQLKEAKAEAQKQNKKVICELGKTEISVNRLYKTNITYCQSYLVKDDGVG